MSDQPNITLTPRQHRALRHLARRHMHRPRITRRRMFADYTSPPVGTQSIAPDEPAVGASAKLAERVSIPSPPPIYRPTGVANISTPDETVGTQPIAPDEPAVGASAKLAERVSIPSPPPIYRPTGAANISTPDETVGTQSIASDEPAVGASAKLAERVSIPSPLPIYRPSGAANISTPDDTVGTQPIASDREEGQPTPDEPAQPAVQAQPIAPDEPPVGADLSSPLPIYRPSGAANISTPSDTIGTQPIAPDKETGQAAHPLPLAYNISPMPSLAELSRPLNAPIPTRDDPRGRPLVPAARKIPPMPPLPMRRASVPVPTQQKHGIISTGQRQYPHYHTLTQRQKRLGHRTRKHLRQVRVSERLARLRFWATIWSIIGLLMVIFMSLGAIGSVTFYDFVQHTQTTYEHQVDTLRSLLPPDNLKIYDSKGVLLAQLTDQGLHTTVKFDQIAPLLRDATVATEDKTFWTNQGVDLLRILRAALDDVQNDRVVEGGSTITQQLIKILLVGDQATIERKLKELVLTPLINNRYSKRDILEMYLNSIYYGHQAYGIDAAATFYYGLQDKPGRPAAMQLDLAQSAMLAGIPSNPNLYDPLLHSDAAYNRFAYVLGLMVSQNYITRLQVFNAIAEAQDPHFFKFATPQPNRAPHFVELVLSELQQMFHLKSRSQLSRSDMVIYTTLDINLQGKIQRIAQQRIAELRDDHNLTNAAEVLINFHTGAIISLLGSIDYNDASIDGQFDVATAYRQPGSSFKPYVYVTAFAQGSSPAQAIDDQPISIALPGSDPPTFSPLNYDRRFHGHMTLRCALQNSLNIPAVKVLEHVGIPAAMQTAYKMGITTYSGTPGYSLVLGGLGIRLLDHTSAMGVFANGGVRQAYYAINKIVSASTGKLLFQHQFGPGKRIISPQLAYMMTDVLSDNTSRIPEFLDCNVLQLYSNSQQDCQNGDRGVVRPAAAKTGTTNDFRDNWTIGYTTDYVMGIWAGNDDNSPMIDVTGVQGAAPIWHDAMLLAEQGHPIRDFTNPGGLVRSMVTYPDGVQATDWFLPDTVPSFVLPTPTPIPMPTPIPTEIPAPDTTPVVTPSPIPTSPAPPPLPHPYCPANYSFAFAPPPPDAPSSGWW